MYLVGNYQDSVLLVLQFISVPTWPSSTGTKVAIGFGTSTSINSTPIEVSSLCVV